MNRMVNIPRLVIAGTESGVGKTTIATGIMAALKNRGLRVQPFKVGPDYIDPTYHTQATGLASRNLDSWMLSHEAIKELFVRAAQQVDICVIEGVMGLFDGHSGSDDSGSTAEVAKLLNAPVILIIDAGKMARSAAAVALGYAMFDPYLDLRGFIINNIGSPRHFEWVRESIEHATSIPVLGYLPKDAEFEMPERHLGLIPTVEDPGLWHAMPLQNQVEKTFDIEQLMNIAYSAETVPEPKNCIFPSGMDSTNRIRTSIAYAWDAAFSFYYQDNLDLLQAHGARLLPFSPLNDSSIPSDAQGIYIGGGFPEMYAEALSVNQSVMDSIRKAAAQGMPIYGECGGLMYLSQGITDLNGKTYAMVGILPGWSIMTQKVARMEYVEFEFNRDTVLGSKGMRLRGHEFHWSEMGGQLSSPANVVIHPEKRDEGYIEGNIHASYIHLHFGTEPNLAMNFIGACSKEGQETTF